ncbi:MAG: hypothetical protein EOL91_13270 [Actinobacteria bacterium]|nr:hypothetical protein [Actinomycetota bacterium]
MSGMDVLRERIARALWDREAERQTRFQRRPWDEAEEWCRDAMRGYADAVIAALGPVAVYGAQQDEDIVWGWEPDVATVRREWPGLPVVRSYVTPWERIEDDA